MHNLPTTQICIVVYLVQVFHSAQMQVAVIMSYSKLIGNVLRNYSNLISNKGSQVVRPSLISQESFVRFEKSLPNIINKVFAKSVYPSVIEDRIRNIAEYNVSGGKKIRGTLTLNAYETLMKDEKVCENSLQQIHTLAWAVEMLQAYFMILDDVQDCAPTRRGKQCWYRLPHVGSQALNDASLLRTFTYDMLKHNFQDGQTYSEFLNLFNKAYLITEIGQHYDSLVYLMSDKNLEKFTMDTYNTIVDNKAVFYSVKLPISVSLKLANKSAKNCSGHVEDMCKNIGRMIQVQNDYLDCYEKDTSSIAGTDIQEGKCTWLAVTALERCTPAQRTVFRACYGSKEPAHIERIKRLYDQLDMPKLYREHEIGVRENVARRAKELGSRSVLPPDIFLRLIDVIQSRTA